MGLSSKQVSCDDHIQQGWNRSSSSLNHDINGGDCTITTTAAADLGIPKTAEVGATIISGGNKGGVGGGGRLLPLEQDVIRHQKLNCPRCDSTNTKFCYYNNYNRSQPRYFCKSCKRHWTQGGTLRKVPVGGGGGGSGGTGGGGRKSSKKKKGVIKSTSSSTSPTTNTSAIKDQGRQQHLPLDHQVDNKIYNHTIFDNNPPPSSSSLTDSGIDFVHSLLPTDHDDEIHQELGSFPYPLVMSPPPKLLEFDQPTTTSTTFSSSCNSTSIFKYCSSSSTQTCTSSVYGYSSSDQSASCLEDMVIIGGGGDHIAAYNNDFCSITDDDHELWKSSSSVLADHTSRSNLLQGWEEIDKFDITIPWDDDDDQEDMG